MRLSIVLLLSSAGVAFAQKPLTFDVASVKPARHGISATAQKGQTDAPAASFDAEGLRFTAQGMKLYGLIVEAWGLKFCRPLESEGCAMLSGAPDWLTKDAFDIDARMPAGSKQYTTMQLRNNDAPQLQERLRNLLAERFHLKTHFEKRQLPVYAFTIADSGIRIKKAEPSETPQLIFRPLSAPNTPPRTQVVAVNSTIGQLADLYAKFMDRPVIDMTGFTDHYDFTVEYEADPDAGGPFAAVTSPSLYQAFEKQAGLKLKATQGPVDVLVVDSATRPTAN